MPIQKRVRHQYRTTLIHMYYWSDHTTSFQKYINRTLAETVSRVSNHYILRPIRKDCRRNIQERKIYGAVLKSSINAQFSDGKYKMTIVVVSKSVIMTK